MVVSQKFIDALLVKLQPLGMVFAKRMFGVIFSWHYDAPAGNGDVLAFAKLETNNSEN